METNSIGPVQDSTPRPADSPANDVTTRASGFTLRQFGLRHKMVTSTEMKKNTTKDHYNIRGLFHKASNKNVISETGDSFNRTIAKKQYLKGELNYLEFESAMNLTLNDLN